MKEWVIGFIARHGSTDSNWEKKFRGWEETKLNQLSDKWKNDARKLWKRIKQLVNGNPDDYILVSSDLNRAKDTTKMASDISWVSIGKEYPELRSQDTGDFTNIPEDEVKPQVIYYTENHPNLPLPWASESHLQFVDRVKKVFNQIPKDYPWKKIIVITHHQVEVLQANDFSALSDDMYKNWIEPWDIRPFNKISYSECDWAILRSIMIAELDTINNYEKMCEETDNEEVKKLIEHIKWEEYEHFEEAQELLKKMWILEYQEEETDEEVEDSEAEEVDEAEDDMDDDEKPEVYENDEESEEKDKKNKVLFNLK